ncbi:MAG: MoaD/ThiS family protein [Deltaproteobacteria bacterium]|nr:MoaD/ThiS family protein [Deltaproteobacteria bacterium]
MKVSFHGYIKPFPHLVNSAEVEGRTVRECLDAFVEMYPSLRESFYDGEDNIGENYAVFLDREIIHHDEFDRAVPEGSGLHIVTLFAGG